MPKITKSFVDKTNEPGVYRDDQLRGFALKVTGKGSKVYIVNGRVRDEGTATVTIGKHGPYTTEAARKLAQEILLLFGQGINPNTKRKAEAKKKQQERALTIRSVFADYIASKDIKPSTAKVYRYVVESRFKDWLDRPMPGITKQEIKERYLDIAQSHPGDANHAVRILRALFEYLIASNEDLLIINPARHVFQQRIVKKLDRRQGIISPADMPAWTSAVIGLDNEVVSDYLLFLLFTGLRKSEAAGLKWKTRELCPRESYIDRQNQMLTIIDTKNHRPHSLPLTDFLREIIERRWQDRGINPHVFPSSVTNGPLVDIRTHIEKVTKESGVPFMLHDLRRSFITAAKRLGIDEDFVKGLANHKDGDVTFGYTVMDSEDRRAIMQRITDYLVTQAKIKEADRKAR